MMRAVILVPAGPDAEQEVVDCMRWCEEVGMPVAEVLVGDGWRAAAEMTLEGRAEVIVISTAARKDPDRVPQVRIVDEERAKAAERRRRRPGKSRRPDVIDR